MVNHLSRSDKSWSPSASYLQCLYWFPRSAALESSRNSTLPWVTGQMNLSYNTRNVSGFAAEKFLETNNLPLWQYYIKAAEIVHVPSHDLPLISRPGKGRSFPKESWMLIPLERRNPDPPQESTGVPMHSSVEPRESPRNLKYAVFTGFLTTACKTTSPATRGMLCLTAPEPLGRPSSPAELRTAWPAMKICHIYHKHRLTNK